MSSSKVSRTLALVVLTLIAGCNQPANEQTTGDTLACLDPGAARALAGRVIDADSCVVTEPVEIRIDRRRAVPLEDDEHQRVVSEFADRLTNAQVNSVLLVERDATGIALASDLQAQAFDVRVELPPTPESRDAPPNRGRRQIHEVSLAYTPWPTGTGETLSAYLVGKAGERLELLGTEELEQLAIQGNGMPRKNSDKETTVKLIDSGDPELRFNIAVVGDGYTESELPKFAEDTNTVIDSLFSYAPFDKYKPMINVYRMDAVSNESGASVPADNIVVANRFGSTVECNDWARIMCIDYGLVREFVYQRLTAAQVDQVLVLVNDDHWAAAGGAIAVSAMHGSAGPISVHELGHSFGHLADEYSYGDNEDQCANKGEPGNINVTGQASGAKWAHWMGQTGDADSPSADVGAYEGAWYCEKNYYRPTLKSTMNWAGDPFHQVNEEKLVKRLHDTSSMINGSSPGGKGFSIEVDQTLRIEAVPIDTLQINWFVNGVKQSETGPAFLSGPHLLGDAKTYQIEARVSDDTPKVIDGRETLTESVIWRAQLDNGCEPATLPDRIRLLPKRRGYRIRVRRVANAESYQFDVRSGPNKPWFSSTRKRPISKFIRPAFKGGEYRVRVIGECGNSDYSPVMRIE